MQRSPRVSVRIPSYNHEKYVAECLQSVLDQTFRDFEIIVTDDGSTDRTVEIIRSFDDPRIKLDVFPENRGCAVAVAHCCSMACGEYIANLCSDDVWEKDKLEKQVDYLDAHPEIAAVFTKVTIIDDDSQIDLNTGYNSLFEVENRSKEQWLRQFFLKGNCLCIPSVMIRRNVYESLNYQDPRMASLPDFDLWVRFSLQYQLHILDERLTRFRLRANNANAGAERMENAIRGYFEYKQILGNYLQITQVDQLMEIFPECAKYGRPTEETIPYFLARIAMDCREEFKQLWGLETLYSYMELPANANRLKQLFNFSYKDLHHLTQTLDPFQLRAIDDLRKFHERMVNTISWKVTQPLRAIRKMLRTHKREG